MYILRPGQPGETYRRYIVIEVLSGLPMRSLSKRV
jgi:hypothetical protein